MSLVNKIKAEILQIVGDKTQVRQSAFDRFNNQKIVRDVMAKMGYELGEGWYVSKRKTSVPNLSHRGSVVTSVLELLLAGEVMTAQKLDMLFPSYKGNLHNIQKSITKRGFAVYVSYTNGKRAIAIKKAHA